MKPLLWKEFRELRAVLLLAAVAFPVCLGLLHVPSVVDRIKVPLPEYFMLAAMLAAVALGAGQVVPERSAKTLDYLLGRPVAGRQVVLAKFIAGSAVLLIFVGLLLALLFFGGKTTSNWLGTAGQFGYARLLVYQFPVYWFLYSCSLLFSTIVEHRAQAVAGGLLCPFAVLIGFSIVLSRWPLLATNVWFPQALAEPPWLALALETSLWVAVAAVWSGLAILVAAVAALILDRHWEIRINWLMIGLLFIAIGVGSNLGGTSGIEIQPTGVYSLGTRTASQPVVNGSRVAVETNEGLVVIDFSDPAHPRQLGQIRLPLRTIDRVKIVGDDVYVVGRHGNLPVDTAAVLRVRVRAPGIWEATQIVSLGPVDSLGRLGEPYVIGKHLYVGLVAGEESRLRVFELPADGPAHQTADVPIEHWRVGPYSAIIPRGVPPFTLAVRGTYAYVAGYSVLLTLDLGDPSNPRLVYRTEFEDSEVLPVERKIACLGNRLYVESFQPPMLRRYDLQEPARPVEKGRSIWGQELRGALVADEARSTLFVAWRDGVLAFPPPEGLWIRDVRYLKGKMDPGTGGRTQPVAAAGGFFYVLIGGQSVAAYPVPR